MQGLLGVERLGRKTITNPRKPNQSKNLNFCKGFYGNPLQTPRTTGQLNALPVLAYFEPDDTTVTGSPSVLIWPKCDYVLI